MTRGKHLSISVAVLLLAPWFTLFDSAEALTGDAIDKTNWERADGLLPEPVLNWVKNGDLSLDMEELNYDPSAYFPQHALDSLQANVGRYDIDEQGWVVDVETATPATHVIGFPFPRIEPNDPKTAEKIVRNKIYTFYVLGDMRFVFQMRWIHPSSGLEREIDIKDVQAFLQGWPGIKDLPNKDQVENTQS